jgi:hypothetical protein
MVPSYRLLKSNSFLPQSRIYSSGPVHSLIMFGLTALKKPLLKEMKSLSIDFFMRYSA